jgi:uroporphyrinogen decarboxylase
VSKVESPPTATGNETMTGRERVICALKHQAPDRVPRDLWFLPGVYYYRRPELDAVLERFPSDFTGARCAYGKAERARGTVEDGSYTDEWGCVWTAAERGVVGEVTESPLADISRLAHFSPPNELLDDADLSEVNASCAETDKFVRVGTSIRPFERLQFLRGVENTYMDLLADTPEIRSILAMLHEFYMRELRMWVVTDVDGISFMDDWGSQNSLLISPDLWRRVFKPLYRDYVELAHRHGKFVFFHSDGFITPIFGDLVELGIDAVNSQLFCQDIESLGELYRGRTTFWGEICRQAILPRGTVEEVKNAVRRVRRALDRGCGGVIAECEWGNQDPKENIEAVFEAWLERPPK